MYIEEIKRRLNYGKSSDSKDFRGGGQSSLSSLTGIGTGFQAACTAKISIISGFLRQWKFNFILPKGLLQLCRGSGKLAFTLAEVLITLGIIGIVAALTMPALIQKNNNKVVETRLKKFYSAINQAILMAEKDYGDKKVWYQDLTGAFFDEEGNVIEGSSEIEKWCKKYLIPYMKVVKTDTLSDGAFIMYFADGSALQPETAYSRDWYFYLGNPQKCINRYGTKTGGLGRCKFGFIFNPSGTGTSWKYHYNKGMDPYKVSWDGNNDTLYSGKPASCKNGNGLYCTAIIQNNNWTIPDDYPFKVSY